MEALAVDAPRSTDARPTADLSLVRDSDDGEAPPESRKRREFREEALPHLDDLYGFALRLTGGEEADARDLVQVAMLRAYRAWETYELGTNCGAWLRTILRNSFVNRFRKEDRRPESAAYEDLEGVSRYDGESALPGSPRTFDRPDEAFFDEVVDDEVVEAVEDLAAEFRVPFVLVDLDGLSYEEAADELGVPVGTIKSRLYRARRRLRERLAEYGREMGYVR